MKQRLRYGVIAAGGALGLVASFLQTTEKIQLLKYKDRALACDLSDVFSCTNVLNAWQSSVFGFPNSLMCLVFFTTFLVVGLIGLAEAGLSRRVRLAVQALSLFVLGFALWFLWQSVYNILALCILCLFCFAGLLFVNWALLRLNAADLPIGQRGRAVLQRAIASGADTFGWIVLGLVVGFAMYLQFS